MSSKSASTPSNKPAKPSSFRKSAAANAETAQTGAGSVSKSKVANSSTNARELGELRNDESEEDVLLLAGTAPTYSSNVTQPVQGSSAAANTAAANGGLTGHSLALLQQPRPSSFAQQQQSAMTLDEATKLFKGLFRANESVASKNAVRLEEHLKRMEAQLQGVTRQVTELKTTVDTMRANADVNQIINRVVDEQFVNSISQRTTWVDVAQDLVSQIRHEAKRDLSEEEVQSFIEKLNRLKKSRLGAHTLAPHSDTATLVGVTYLRSVDQAASEVQLRRRIASRLNAMIPLYDSGNVTTGKLTSGQKKRALDLEPERSEGDESDNERPASQEAARAVIAAMSADIGGPRNAFKRTRFCYAIRMARAPLLKQLQDEAQEAAAVQQSLMVDPPVQKSAVHPAFEALDDGVPSVLSRAAVTDDELDSFFA